MRSAGTGIARVQDAARLAFPADVDARDTSAFPRVLRRAMPAHDDLALSVIWRSRVCSAAPWWESRCVQSPGAALRPGHAPSLALPPKRGREWSALPAFFLPVATLSALAACGLLL